MAGKRTYAYRLMIAWTGGTYTDETTRLLSASGSCRLTAPNEPLMGGKGQVDRCVLELDNYDGRYSPMNENSPLNDNTEASDALVNGNAYHRPMYLEVKINTGSFYRIFTGVIKLPSEDTLAPNKTATVRIDCRSMDELLLGMKQSTLLSAAQAWTDAGYSEGQMIEALLLNANVIDYTVDKGMVLVPYVWLDDESVLDEVWNIASAVGGRFYCDADGEYRYEDSTHWLKSPHQTSQETIGRNYFDGFSPAYDDNSLFNSVTIETSPRILDVPDILWEPESLTSVPAGETKEIIAKLKQAAWQIDPVEVKATTLGAQDISSSVSLTQTNYVQRVKLAYTNNHATATAYLRPLKITGKALKGGPSEEVTKTSADDGFNSTWWTTRGSERNKNVRGNVYVQTEAHASAMALMLLHRYEKARLSYKLNGVDGVPTRRLGDRITISDDETMTTDRAAFITGITFKLDGTGFVQDLECADADSLYPYAATGEDGYFLIGDGDPVSSKVGASGTGTAYLWY